MRRLLLFFLFLVSVGIGVGQETLHRMVGPGILHRKFYLTKGPWAVDLLEVDLTNPYVTIETVKADDQIIGREKTSTMAYRQDRNGHWVVGAVNADFFEANGTPVNCQVVKGMLLKTPNKYSVLGFSPANKPFIEILHYSGIVMTPRKQVHKIHGVNRSRETEELVVYNRFFGTNTQTNIWGAEVRFQAIGSWAVNDTFQIKILEIDSTRGNQNIPGNGGVLSGHGSARNWLLHQVGVGDTLKMFLQLGPIQKKITQAVGGIPRIIRNGNISIEEGYKGTPFATSRHPRTAVGFSRDSTRLFLFTVDGRQPGYSVGMNLEEVARFLLNLGAYQAINLDGGGSTTMVIRNTVQNRPSDNTGERPVANALLVISTAKLDTLSILHLMPDSIRLFQGETVRFTIAGYDRFYNPIELKPSDLTWNYDPSLGVLDEQSGSFRAGRQHRQGFIFARSGFVVDSIKVIVDIPVAILPEQNELFLSVGVQYPLTVKILDTGGRVHPTGITEFSWQVSDSFLTVTSTGILLGRAPGNTSLTLRYDSLQVTIPVHVAIPGQVVLDNFSYSPFRWTLSGVNSNEESSQILSSDSVYVSPPEGLALRYEYEKRSVSSYFTLERQFQLSYPPDAFTLWFYGDGNPARVQGYFIDRNRRLYSLDFNYDGNSDLTWSDRWYPVTVNFSEARTRGNLPPQAPIQWHHFKIYFQGGAPGQIVSGTIYLDDFLADYLTDVPILPEQNDNLPYRFQLSEGYPNPCPIPRRSVQFRVQVSTPGTLTMTIFNVLGERIYSSRHEFSRGGMHRIAWDGSTHAGDIASTGLYLADLEYLGEHRYRKLLLIH